MKSCIPGINISILQNKHYENIFSEDLVNELNSWIENHPHVIHSTNVKYSLFVKISNRIVKKQKHIPQFSLQDLHNDMILPIYAGVFLM